jgi:hypothetical protein
MTVVMRFGSTLSREEDERAMSYQTSPKASSADIGMFRFETECVSL